MIWTHFRYLASVGTLRDVKENAHSSGVLFLNAVYALDHHCGTANPVQFRLMHG
eukprot:m.1643620 g.1643620  ORF g.1643620 m.1643620 type:complete len:54 (-) comp59468_c0_seq1:14-175(-)